MYAVGDRVIAKREIWQDASDEHPECELAAAGDELEVRVVKDPMWSAWPVYVAHPHREKMDYFGVRLDEIRPA